MPAPRQLNHKQQLFRDMLLGTLLYTVVLGFFNDYTDILHTGTYSVTFAVAVVMQILTYLTFLFKDWVVNRSNRNDASKLRIALSVWLIMFFSKFVFLGIISIIFSEDVVISGFIGLLLMIIVLTIAQKLVYVIDTKLASSHI